MKPFSPLYFIQENRTRCALLIFMIFLGCYAAYLGGLYITNALSNYDEDLDAFEHYAAVKCLSADTAETDYNAVKELVQDDPHVEIIDQIGISNMIYKETILGFENTPVSYTFRSAEDFETYCMYLGIDCDFSRLGDGSLILTDMLAKNAQISIGEQPDKEQQPSVYGDFTLDEVTSQKGYAAYFIDGANESRIFFIMNKSYDNSAFLDFTNGLRERYSVYVENYESFYNLLNEQMRSLIYIYALILVLMAVVMAVTVNAGFVGMYQRRHYEFAVYRALGFSRAELIGKIAGELLCMDLMGLAAGAVVFFPALYLFNSLVLYPSGKYLEYFHPTALWGLLLCDVIIMIPLIVTRCRSLLKADISEY